jgi:hypothetical protein
MRDEYDFSKMTNVVRGKHYKEYQKDTNIVLLAPDGAAAFPNSDAVTNDAEEAARFYAQTFPDSSVGAIHRAPSDFPGGKEGGAVIAHTP